MEGSMWLRLMMSAGLLLAACDAAEEAPVSERGAALVRMNSSALGGVALSGVRLSGEGAGSLSLSGGVLRAAAAAEGGAGAPEALIGAELSATQADGSALLLRVDDVRRGASPNEDLSLYTLSFWAAPSQGWQPLCGQDAAGQLIAALPLAGAWDAATGAASAAAGWITFACRGAALAKCVEMGYRPWQSPALAELHQACARMVRADYCGDGKPFTLDGRVINVYDALGVQADSEAWTFEAEWNAQGAVCLSQQRVYQLQLQLEEANQPPLPACLTSRVALDCGQPAHFSSGATLLMNEFETGYVGVRGAP